MTEAAERAREVVTAEVVNTPAETERIAQCEKWFDESKRFMDKRRERWRLNEKVYYNEMKLDVPEGGTEMQIALALALIHTEMPIVSDFFPTFDVLPADENDRPFADMMQRRTREIERVGKFKRAGVACVLDAKIYSNGILGVMAETHQESAGESRVGESRVNGNGSASPGDGVGAREVLDRIRFDVKDLFSWFPAPDARGMKLGEEARYHIFATPMHVDEVERVLGKRIAAEGGLDEYRSFAFREKGGDYPVGGEYVLLKEVYAMDVDMATYPAGRVTLYANGVMLQDGPLVRFPYFMVGNYKSMHALFGIGETELIRYQCKALNETIGAIADTIRRTAHPVRKVTRSLMNTLQRAILGIPGEQVVVDKMSDIEWETPPQVPAHTFAFMDYLLQFAEFVTGARDVVQGKKPSGVESGKAIRYLQEAAQGRVREQLANEIADFVEEVGRTVVELVRAYDVSVKQIPERDVTGRRMYQDYDAAHRFDAAGVREDQVGFDPMTGKRLGDTAFDVEVVTGTRLPAGRVEAEERALAMYEKGLYGPEDVLEHTADPNKERVLQRFYVRQGVQQLMAKQEAMNKAFAEFEGLVERAIRDAAGFAGSLWEDQMARIVEEFFEFTRTEEWGHVPAGVRDRVLAGVMDRVAGSAEAGSEGEAGSQGVRESGSQG